MSQDFYPIGQHHCYACIQWDGTRSYDAEHGKIKVDSGSLGTCRITHAQVRGTSSCDNYYPLR